MPTVEVRCPVGPQRLLFKLQIQGQTAHVSDDNLMELSCSDCKRLYRRDDPSIKLVVHCYNFLGELVKTVVT